jgi:probable phosphoglycerate mutase
MRHGEAGPDGTLTEAGREQARLTGQRLAGQGIPGHGLPGLPLSAIQHGPAPRAAQTAALVAGYLPGVPVQETAMAGDYLPADPDLSTVPTAYAKFLRGFSPAERTEGPELAIAAVDRFAGPGPGPGDGRHELVVTHNFLIGWLVCQAMQAPDWRWMGLNQQNCALTVILYQDGKPPSLISYNDAGHLPPHLRWTGFPAPLRPPAG